MVCMGRTLRFERRHGNNYAVLATTVVRESPTVAAKVDAGLIKGLGVARTGGGPPLRQPGRR